MKKKQKLVVSSTMKDAPTDVYLDNFVDEEDGGFKVDTMVDSGSSIVIYRKTVCQMIGRGDKLYKGVVDCPEYEIIEFDVVDKKYRLYKVELEGEIDITDEQIANFRKELKQLPNKEF